jgi:hypothetical protein
VKTQRTKGERGSVVRIKSLISYLILIYLVKIIYFNSSLIFLSPIFNITRVTISFMNLQPRKPSISMHSSSKPTPSSLYQKPSQPTSSLSKQATYELHSQQLLERQKSQRLQDFEQKTYLPKVHRYRSRAFDAEVRDKKFESVLVLFEKDRNLLVQNFKNHFKMFMHKY